MNFRRLVLAGLGAQLSSADDPGAARPGPFPAVRVPDPIAEALLVALEAGRSSLERVRRSSRSRALIHWMEPRASVRGRVNLLGL
jgi:hypothetical protein